MMEFLVSVVASYACGSLSKQLWISANKIAENPRAREQVFKAANRIFKIGMDRKESVVDNFGQCTRFCSVVAGGQGQNTNRVVRLENLGNEKI